MTRLLVYLFLMGLLLYFFSAWNKKQAGVGASIPREGEGKPRSWFKPKKNPREVWIQVYETASIDEARMMQARLQEEELECIVYEQGKKDIHGNSLKGVGLAVPKTVLSFAQKIISRMSF